MNAIGNEYPVTEVKVAGPDLVTQVCRDAVAAGEPAGIFDLLQLVAAERPTTPESGELAAFTALNGARE